MNIQERLLTLDRKLSTATPTLRERQQIGYLLNALTLEEIKALKGLLDPAGYILYHIKGHFQYDTLKENVSKSYRVRKCYRNEDLSVRISNYSKAKGNQQEGFCLDLMEMYHYLVPEQQALIVEAFLNGREEDRDWICDRMLTNWQTEFLPLVLKSWRETPLPKTNLLILRNFPIRFIRQEREKLMTFPQYYELCLRLLGDPDFTLDWEKLKSETTLPKYLEMKARAGAVLPTEEARELFFTLLAELIYWQLKRGTYDYGRPLLHCSNACYFPEPDPLSNVHVQKCLSYFYLLGQEDLVEELNHWADEVQQDALETFQLPDNLTTHFPCHRFFYYQKALVGTILGKWPEKKKYLFRKFVYDYNQFVQDYIPLARIHSLGYPAEGYRILKEDLSRRIPDLQVDYSHAKERIQHDLEAMRAKNPSVETLENAFRLELVPTPKNNDKN